jgi:hypothetical protein
MLPYTGRGHMLKDRVSRERTDTKIILRMYQFVNMLVASLILQEWQLWLLTRANKCHNILGLC